MREIYVNNSENKNKKGMVNLYLNDVYALKKTIMKLNEIHSSKKAVQYTNQRLSQDYSEDCDMEEWS